jgi:hypothetical protein
MSREGTHARAVLDAWREQGADRMDRVRFHRIDALERRAAGHDGQVRRLLDSRLTELIGAYADDLDRAACQAVDAGSATAPDAPAPARGVLGELVDYIAHQTTVGHQARSPELLKHDALEQVTDLWARLRAQSQLRQALEQAPADAGPLNSTRLVHRSLTLMRELSPGYLEQFMSYVDALSWMELAFDSGLLGAQDKPQVASGGRRGGRKSRERRD